MKQLRAGEMDARKGKKDYNTMDGWKRKVISRVKKKWSCRRTPPVRSSGNGLPCLLCFALLCLVVQCSVVLSFVPGLASQCSNLFHSPFPSLHFPSLPLSCLGTASTFSPVSFRCWPTKFDAMRCTDSDFRCLSLFVPCVILISLP